MHPEELFRDNLALVERVIDGVCRRAGLRDADAEDFASNAKLALIENDYAILRGYEGRAPLGAFLAVVVQRMLSREWMRLRGRWHQVLGVPMRVTYHPAAILRDGSYRRPTWDDMQLVRDRLAGG